MSKVFFILFLSVVTLPLHSQNDAVGMGMATPGVVAKPSFETTTSGLHLRVWIMSVVNDSKDQTVGSKDSSDNFSFTDETRKGSHHVIVEVKDAAEGTELTSAAVKMQILAPTGKTFSVDMEPMLNQYGANIPLESKGEYKLSLNVKADDGRTVESPFSYIVK